MEIYQGVILGILQGLTEFLPVSSSGHLVLGQIFFNITEFGLVFDTSVHMGTLGAVFIVYFKDILEILKSLVYYAGTRDPSGHETNLALAAAIVIGSVPTAIIGLVLKHFEHILFTSSLLVGAMLILTGALLWISRRYYRIDTGEPLTISRAVIIGIVQGLAVIPAFPGPGPPLPQGFSLAWTERRRPGFLFTRI